MHQRNAETEKPIFKKFGEPKFGGNLSQNLFWSNSHLPHITAGDWKTNAENSWGNPAKTVSVQKQTCQFAPRLKPGEKAGDTILHTSLPVSYHSPPLHIEVASYYWANKKWAKNRVVQKNALSLPTSTCCNSLCFLCRGATGQIGKTCQWQGSKNWPRQVTPLGRQSSLRLAPHPNRPHQMERGQAGGQQCLRSWKTGSSFHLREEQ